MGFFSNIFKRRKKEDDIIEENINQSLNRDIGGEMNYHESYLPNFSSIQQSQSQTLSIEKELEVLSSKLDAIKAMLESINQRLSSIERTIYNENKKWF